MDDTPTIPKTTRPNIPPMVRPMLPITPVIAEELSLSNTGKLLGRYSDLIAKGGLDSAQCREFRAEHDSDRKLHRLMGTVDRLWQATHSERETSVTARCQLASQVSQART